MILAWTVVGLAISLAACAIGAAYPYVKHINAAPVAIQGNVVTIKGTVDIYFCERAWEEIGYKPGNFKYYDRWWHEQIGNTYCYMGVRAQLVYIDWTLLHHYCDHDRLSYVLKVKVLSF
jgi:hypothetical protein